MRDGGERWMEGARKRSPAQGEEMNDRMGGGGGSWLQRRGKEALSHIVARKGGDSCRFRGMKLRIVGGASAVGRMPVGIELRFHFPIRMTSNQRY